MEQINSQQIQRFVDACHRIGGYGLVRCSSGNLSSRLDKERILLSASKSWLEEITADQIVVWSLEQDRCVNGKTPTIEADFHLGILRNRPEINVVLHFQSPYATAIACGRPQDYNFNVIIEVPAYIGKPAIVEYLPPGSQQLAHATIEALKDSDLAILRNHGLVTVGADYSDAIQKARFFELACRIILCQNRPEFLSQDNIDALRKASKV